MLNRAPTTPISPPVRKERCPTDGHTILIYRAAGIQYFCRHCKQEHVVAWEEILRRYAEVARVGEA